MAFLTPINYNPISPNVAPKTWVSAKYNMIADFFTKPLQGTLFRKFRDFILNETLNEEDNDESDETME